MKFTIVSTDRLKLPAFSNQIWLTMKLMMVILTFGLLQVSAEGTAQNVNFSGENVSLEKVFNAIKKQTGYLFFYRTDDMAQSKPVSVQLKNATLSQALDKVFEGQPLGYSIQKNTIVITRKTVEIVSEKKLIITEEMQAPPIDIKAKVVDENGKPISGVSVTIKGSKKGATTNANGDFSLNSVDEETIIIISFIGYKSIELKAKNVKGEIQMSLVDSKMEDVSVVSTGYGTLKRRNLTDAVVSLNPKILETTNITSVGNLIQGQLAGVNVLTGNSAPGAPVRIRIRGDATINDGAEPLIVVDGVPMPDDYNLNDINPNDIAAIDILKGASSAAIYGSRASAGVIEIRTKRGSQYTKPQISYSYNYGVKSLEQKIQSLNADQFKDLFEEGLLNYISGAFNVRADNDSLKKWVRPSNNRNYYDFYLPNDKFGGANTDWVGLMIKPAITQDHFISLRGGDKKTQYSFSYGKNLEEGMLIGSNYDRNTISMNYDQNFSDNLKVGFSAMGGFSETNGTVSIGTVTNMRPDAAAYNDDGSYHIFTYEYFGTNQVDNPLILANDVTKKSIGKVLSVSPYGELKFWKDFKFTSRYNLSLNLGSRTEYYPRTTRVGQNYSTATGSLIDTRSQNSSSTFTNYLTYYKTIKEHDLIAVVGTELNKSKSEYVTERYLNFADDRIQNAIWQAATYRWADGDVSETESIGYYGRLNYKFKNRYLLTGSFRVDGSSRFAPKNRFGFFPAVSAAYIMSDEAFFSKIKKTLNLLKFRVSTGKTGNDRVGAYSWLAQYQSGVSYMNLPGVRPTDLGNDNLKWESSTEYNLGLDFGFLANNRIRGSFDIYKKDVSNMLIAIPMAPSTGVTSVYQNFGDLTNKGVELSLSAVAIEKGAFSWEVGMNIAKNSNVLTRLGIDRASTTSGQTWLTYYVIEEGQPLGLVYGYKTDGIFKSYAEVDQYEALNPGRRYQETSYYTMPGDIKFVDASGDGYVSSGSGKDDDAHEDRRVIGKTQPDFWGGLTTTLQYKELRLGITGTFQKGGVKYWKYAETQFQMNNIAPNNVDVLALKRWTPENPNANYPSFRNSYYTNKINDFWLYDASFLKIQEINLSYNLPNKLLGKTRVISGLNVYASLHNVITFTKYPGYNVESFSTNPLEGSMMDNSSYPNERTFRIGARVMF